jgi:hypothetical protein
VLWWLIPRASSLISPSSPASVCVKTVETASCLRVFGCTTLFDTCALGWDVCVCLGGLAGCALLIFFSEENNFLVVVD